MNKEIIQTAIRNGTLRKYDLNQAQAGDKVLGWKPGKVLAVYGEDVVFGWDRGGRKSVNIFRTHHAHEIYLAPLCWVEDKPVYKGDVLYLPKGTVKVRTIDRVEKFRSYDDDGKAITRLRVYGDDGFWDSPEKLTWIDPSSYEVEGKVLKVGDTLFSKDGDKVTITALEMGYIITTPGQVMGGTQWTADYLSWADPTILFEVEGKPVRKGDVLYSPSGRIVKRVIYHVLPYKSYDKEDNPITRLRVYGDDGFWDSPEKLTWTKPKTHIVINGFDVPEPEREPLPNDTTYYVPDLYNGGAWGYEWDNGEVDHRLLNSGLIHLTKEAATAHAKALISLTKS